MNFSDLYGSKGFYPHYKKYPFVLGFEGYGEVVEISKNSKNDYLLGKKVNFLSDA